MQIKIEKKSDYRRIVSFHRSLDLASCKFISS